MAKLVLKMTVHPVKQKEMRKPTLEHYLLPSSSLLPYCSASACSKASLHQEHSRLVPGAGLIPYGSLGSSFGHEQLRKLSDET
uniref:Uncharacterized protein n=1 Tax=Zea mays TaxID=4577 RepID=C4IYN0_MAIZE|nr:unknown [Zea mays]